MDTSYESIPANHLQCRKRLEMRGFKIEVKDKKATLSIGKWRSFCYAFNRSIESALTDLENAFDADSEWDDELRNLAKR